MKGEDADRNKSKQWSSPDRGFKEKDEDPKLWRVFLVGLIGATATTFVLAVGIPLLILVAIWQWQASQLRRSIDWIYTQLARSKSSPKGGPFRSFSQEEARRRYNRRSQEEYEDEMERLERIRRMQGVFNREQNKHKRSYESWKENGPGAYHQHFQRNDWYWKADTSYRNQGANYRQPQRERPSYPLSHHYTVLGLDRSRKNPYTEDEIKTAFRAKAKQFHPDQNQDDKEFAEAKFKEVMVSYEAIKQERKNTRS